MLGGGRVRFEPSKPLPRPAIVVLVLAFANFVIGWLLLLTINQRANQFPTLGHSYQFHMRGNRTYYLSSSIGWYLDNELWIYFGGFALFFLIAYLYGVRWRRVR
jgi:hypothetical protein